MMRLLVGISCDWEEGRYLLEEGYVAAVRRAGGVPVVLPALSEAAEVEVLLSVLKAVVISGGGFDIDPRLYGELPHPRLKRIVPARTGFELRLVRAACRLRLPILGICGGAQLINVALGGSLYQHLPEDVPYGLNHLQREAKTCPSHKVHIARDSRLYELLQVDEIEVNSTHHQAVKALGQGLKAVAWAEDGVIEAIEGEGDGFCLGVQWHPEALVAAQPKWLAIFQALIADA